MATILLTGFEPFGGLDFNPTEHIVQALSAAGETGLVAALLPTSYRRAESEIVELLSKHRPSRVLMLGLKRRSSRLCFEQIASNMDHSFAPDNDGDIRVRASIIEAAPDSYPNTLQYELMEKTAIEKGESVECSNDAGGYVCNHAYFVAAHYAAKELEGCRCGFVHIPPVAEDSVRLTQFTALVLDWIKQLENKG
jgi:pyroglutamyl-peptidase